MKHIGGWNEFYKYTAATYDYKKLYDIAYIATINLNKVIDINYYPVPQAKLSNMKHRPIGLGIQGLADALVQLRVPFESEEAIEFNAKTMETIYLAAITASNDMAKDRYNDMKTFCQSHSSIFGKKKMVVVDDIDTVNEQSQQVFRNYIDKYKHNIHFISVCTNVQKVIESIQSRVHMIQLPSPSEEEVRSIMEHIIMKEGLLVDKEARDYLWKISGGSLRVLINYLEKIYIYGAEVDISLCKQICSTISIQKFENYITSLSTGKLDAAIKELYSMHDQGYSVIDILDYFYAFMKTSHLPEETQYKIVPILCKYITIFHKIHEDVIELAFFTNQLYTTVFHNNI
jgi:DNA polymerase III delta prime subunit